MNMRSTSTKPFFATVCAVAMSASLFACGSNGNTSAVESNATTAEQTYGAVASPSGKADAKKSEGVMSYAEYDAAKVDDAVTIEAYVQAKQAWYEDKASLYLQDNDGGYFVYSASCSKNDYKKLDVGQKVKVSGYKSEWSGENEIGEDATIEIEDGTFVAAPIDATPLLGTDELVSHQNQRVSFANMTVVASKDADGKDAPFVYKYDGSGTEGDDLYFKASDGKDAYTFTVESDLCDKSSDVYQGVTKLKVGDTISMEGFLYWYEGVNPHVTSITIH